MSDAFTTALGLLSRRELSTRQLRERLTRRGFSQDDIDAVVERLTADRTLDDRRVALAAARSDAAVRRRGRRRALHHLQQIGIARHAAEAAVDEVYGELDEAALLDRALEKRLRGTAPETLDALSVARVVRSLVSRGFDASEVYARLRRKRTESDE